VLWNGEEVGSRDHACVGRIVLRDPSLLRDFVVHPFTAFGDGYASGRIEIEGDLGDVLESLFRVPQRHGALARLRDEWLLRRRRSCSVRDSRENVHHHYDLGNDFYRLWLDRRMAYTCAYFPVPEATLEEAQLAKMEHVARKVWVRPGDRVVEAGCGWGTLALHLAGRHGAHVTAYNISSEQVRYARELAKAEGLSDRVEFREDDYRNIRGEYDVFLSVGMLEHVGPENHAELGRVIDRSLGPGGRGLIHSIGRVQRRPMDPWSEARIFPGCYPPTLEEMVGIVTPHGFALLDVENLRQHYERTLAHWLERFERTASTVEQSFDRDFVRTWRLYLAGAMASFRVGHLQLWQLAFARERLNDLPWTRARLHAPAGGGAPAS
jgi:cyclopropane-fatty-acyl-phospholipid synthase